jgi:hypothetical protein
MKNILVAIIIYCSMFSMPLKAQQLVFESGDLSSKKSDFIVFNPGLISDSLYYSNDESVRLTKKSAFGLTTELKNLKPGDIYEFSMLRHKSNRNINLIVTASWNNYYAVVLSNAESLGDWEKVAWQVTVPQNCMTANMSVYAFNYNSHEGFVDELKVIKKEKIDSILPVYMLAPLYYEVANHLQIKYQIEIELNNIDALNEDQFPSELFEYYTTNLSCFKKSIKNAIKKYGKETLINKINKCRQNLKTSTSLSPIEPKMEVISCAAYLSKLVHFKNEKLEITFDNLPKEYDAKIYSLENKYSRSLVRKVKLKSKKVQCLKIKDLKEGFYQLEIKSKECKFSIPFIKQLEEKESICIVAPVSTWHAYNMYGGKSLYRNNIDYNTVNEVSTKRPITSIDLDSTYGGHDFYILKNMYDWFNTNYGATVLPDFWLEKYPERFIGFKTIVLAQHCEYFSSKMYSSLIDLTKTRNLVSMGGNQIYWKIKWNSTFDTLECRKDWSFFKNSLQPGMHWRNKWFGEAALLGVGYTHSGIGTYSSFSIANKEHWLYKNSDTSVNKFGASGYDGRGLSGDETDEIMPYSPENTETIALGNNEGNGGGHMVLIDRGDYATYSCGAISCAAGIGVDNTFTTIIINFLNNYHLK